MTKTRFARAVALAMCLFSSCALPLSAQSLTDLQIASAAENRDPVFFDLAALDEMEQVTFRTTTLWTDGEIEFSGVPLKALLDQLDISPDPEGAAVEMTALNDYKVVMPLTVLEEGAPIIATRMDGAPMSVRDKGPYWVVFPYDQETRFQSETIYSYSIWQLAHIRVID